MTGLVQKYLLAGHISAFMIIFITTVAAIGGFVMRIPDAHSIATFSISGAFAVNMLSHIYRKDDANWQLLETTMPIKLARVELSRYLALLATLVLIVFATAIYTLTNYLGGVFDSTHYAVRAFIDSIELASGFYFIFATAFFPLLRLVNPKNSIGVAYACFMGTLVLFIAIQQVASRLPQSLQDVGYWPFTAATFLLFVLSYFVSVRLYLRRCAV